MPGISRNNSNGKVNKATTFGKDDGQVLKDLSAKGKNNLKKLLSPEDQKKLEARGKRREARMKNSADRKGVSISEHKATLQRSSETMPAIDTKEAKIIEDRRARRKARRAEREEQKSDWSEPPTDTFLEVMEDKALMRTQDDNSSRSRLDSWAMPPEDPAPPTTPHPKHNNFFKGADEGKGPE